MNVKLTADSIIITMPRDLLASVAREEDIFYNLETGDRVVEISDSNEFTEGVYYELISERVDGTTLVQEMFAEAIVRAVENGTQGLDWKE